MRPIKRKSLRKTKEWNEIEDVLMVEDTKTGKVQDVRRMLQIEPHEVKDEEI